MFGQLVSAYAQADLSLCWSHIPHCWKSHALVHLHLKIFTNVISYTSKCIRTGEKEHGLWRFLIALNNLNTFFLSYSTAIGADQTNLTSIF